MVGALLGRSEAQVRRSAALYALLDREKAVTVVHLKAALGLWQYAEDSVHWIFGRRTGDSMVERIVDGVYAKGELTDSEISGLFSNNVPAARLNAAKQAAEQASLIHQVILSGTGGRNQRVWRPGRKPETRPSREPKALFRLLRVFRLRKPREA